MKECMNQALRFIQFCVPQAPFPKVTSACGRRRLNSLSGVLVRWFRLSISISMAYGQVLFHFNLLHFSFLLPKFWAPEPQIGRRGCRIIVSYTGEAY